MMKRRIAIVVAVFAACGAYVARSMMKTPRTGKVENPYAPIPIEVRYRDAKVGEVTVDKGEVTFFARRKDPTYDAKDDLSFFVATPCGTQRIAQVFTFGDDDDRFHADMFRSHWVASVDNRGGPARRLRVGEMDIAVAADQVVRRELYVEPCAGDIRVRLDDEELGAVRGGYGFLVDPTGKRCYRLREVKYGGLFLPFGGAPPEKIERYDGKKLHPMNHIVEHLLERAPDKVETYTMKGMVPSAERNEVLECEAPEL